MTVVQKAHDILDAQGCNRIYSSLKFDIRKGKENRLTQKIQSVEEKIGTVNH